jgi:hypothetical protein
MLFGHHGPRSERALALGSGSPISQFAQQFLASALSRSAIDDNLTAALLE